MCVMQVIMCICVCNKHAYVCTHARTRTRQHACNIPICTNAYIQYVKYDACAQILILTYADFHTWLTSSAFNLFLSRALDDTSAAVATSSATLTEKSISTAVARSFRETRGVVYYGIEDDIVDGCVDRISNC